MTSRGGSSSSRRTRYRWPQLPLVPEPSYIPAPETLCHAIAPLLPRYCSCSASAARRGTSLLAPGSKAGAAAAMPALFTRRNRLITCANGGTSFLYRR